VAEELFVDEGALGQVDVAEEAARWVREMEEMVDWLTMEGFGWRLPAPEPLLLCGWVGGEC
jgi:hypothetical protein